MRRLHPSRLRRSAIFLAGAWALYLLAANLLLASPAAQRWINRRPDRLHVAWRGAWTPFPGYLRLASLEVVGHGGRTEWWLELGRAGLWIDLPALADRRFHALGVRGRELRFRLRRFRDGSVAPATADALPPIPAPSPTPGRPPARRSPSRRWHVDLDGAVFETLREVWIERYRYLGGGRLTGDLRLTVGGPLAVPRGRLLLEGGRLVSGRRTLAADARLDLRGRLRPFTPRVVHGAAIFRFLDAELDARARADHLGVFNLYLTHAPWLRLDGQGRLEAHLECVAGVLRPGSRADVDAPRIAATYLGYRAEGRGRLSGTVAAGPPERATLALTLDRFTLSRLGETVPHARGRGFRVEATSSRLALGERFPDLEVTLDLPRTEVPDLAYYDRYLPRRAGIAIHGGRGILTGHLEARTAEHSADGRLELTGDGVEIDFQGTNLRGDLDLHTVLRRADLEARRFDLTGTRLTLSDVTATTPGSAATRGWWARAELTAGSLELGTRAAIDARIDLALRDSRPLVSFFLVKKPALRPLEGLLDVADLRGRAHLVADGRRIRLDPLTATGDHLELAARLRLATDSRTGLLFVRYGPFSAAAASEGARREWKLVGARRWYSERRLPPD